MDISKNLQRQQNPQQCFFPKLLYLRRDDLGWLLAWSCSLAQGSHVPMLRLRRRHRLTGEPPPPEHAYLSIYLSIIDLSLSHLLHTTAPHHRFTAPKPLCVSWSFPLLSITSPLSPLPSQLQLPATNLSFQPEAPHFLNHRLTELQGTSKIQQLVQHSIIL